MAGVTDVPFRQLAWQFGVGHVVGEMVSARGDLWDTTKSRLRRTSVAGITPVAVQIAGADPRTIAAAALRHWQDGAQIIDINFGCPAKKVCRKAAGSALLADPDLVARIVRAAVAAVAVPVTVKIRSGYSPARRNGVEIARIAEAEGASAVTVHGRTRACRFLGQAEHDTVASIKAALTIPVFANGDISDAATAADILAATRVDGIMIGRAALGAPWLPGQIAGVTAEPDQIEKLQIMFSHVDAMHQFYGEPGVRIARKHVLWYLQKLAGFGTADQRRLLARSFNRLDEPAAQLAFLQELVQRCVTGDSRFGEAA